MNLSQIARLIAREGIPATFRLLTYRILLLYRWRFVPFNVDKVKILNVSSLPPLGWAGGSALQMLWRLQEESKIREVFLLFPYKSVWYLAKVKGSILYLKKVGEYEIKYFVDGFSSIIKKLSPEIVHFENLALFDYNEIFDITNTTCKVFLSLLDFAFFCPRYNLLPKGSLFFCNYEKRYEVCSKCLDGDFNSLDIAIYRDVMKKLLAKVEGVIVPSHFLLNKIKELGYEGKFFIIELPTYCYKTPISSSSFPPRKIALLGGGLRSKGGIVAKEIVERLPQYEWYIFGGYGNYDFGNKVNYIGFYSPGSLSKLLIKYRIDVSVIPSTWPETYSLLLSESILAGVPVITFDIGAFRERVRYPWGIKVDLRKGVGGIVEALESCKRNFLWVPDYLKERIKNPTEVADRMVDVYYI